MMIRIDIKPMSNNRLWQGRRFKTKEYDSYRNAVMLLLPPNIPRGAPPYRLTLIFGLSNRQADLDNNVKAIQDLLQWKYQFNDRDIYELQATKMIVKKGEEFIEFMLESIPDPSLS